MLNSLLKYKSNNIILLFINANKALRKIIKRVGL